MCDYVGIVGDEFILAIGEASEAPDVCDNIRYWPFHKSLDLFGLCPYPPSANAEADEVSFFCGELTLATLDVEFLLAEALKNSSDILQMFFPTRGVYDDIVHVGGREMAHVVKCHVHGALKGARGIREPKWHD